MSTSNATRGGSQSPAEGKQNGGVALPGSAKLEDSERQVSQKVYSPYKVDGAKSVTKLSAGASPFKPGTMKAGPPPIHLLNKNSTADVPDSAKESTPNDMPTIVTSPTVTQTNGVTNGKAQRRAQPDPPAVYFTTDLGPMEFQGGHYLKIDNLTPKDVKKWDDIAEDCDIQQMLRGMKSKYSGPDGNRISFYCCFDDTRGTSETVRYIEDAQLNHWAIGYISQTEYAGAPEGDGSPEKSSYHDGQVLFVASFTGPTVDFKPEGANVMVHKLADSFGEMRAFTQVNSAAFPNLEFRAEYYSIKNAKQALSSATEKAPHIDEVGDRRPLLLASHADAPQNWKVIAKELPDYKIQVVGAGAKNDTAMAAIDPTAVRIIGTPPQDGQGKEFASPSGRTTWRIDENGQEKPTKPMLVLPKVGSIPYGQSIAAVVQAQYTPTRGRYHSDPTQQISGHMMQGMNMSVRNNSWNGNGSVHHSYSRSSPVRSPTTGPQAVEVWKIQNGQDVRTTIMLRNIPNRMSYFDLKNVLDENCYGNYDFSYLRIDFEKGTNVGYAFVNFADPMNIIPFVVNKVGRRWQADNPRKVELSYATVQGFDCLVEKFRNSAIMSEYKDYRPKLWHTFMSAPTDALVNEEMDFPSANNLSKKQRSMDNAGSIGLYAPRSSQNNRERGRFSQWDRGTPQQVEHDQRFYQEMSPMPNGQYSHHPSGYGPSGFDSGYASNGFNRFNGYNGAPRNMGPPPPFNNMVFNNGFQFNPYANGNGLVPQQMCGYPGYDAGDVFGPNYNNGGYSNGFQNNSDQGGNGYGGNGYGGNGYAGNGHNGGRFGTGRNTPPSRLRTQTDGRLGGRPKNVTTVQSPDYSPTDYTGPLAQVVESDEGYNETTGPHYCPKL
ncbi:hypothetical protein LTR53_000983 [Teratosphaeriaceae sp. CCFEE 6253]|nr:hypothetical protein LTR53_000983 [Teratosphaeriaceae sp. CCFEE 6253]